MKITKEFKEKLNHLDRMHMYSIFLSLINLLVTIWVVINYIGPIIMMMFAFPFILAEEGSGSVFISIINSFGALFLPIALFAVAFVSFRIYLAVENNDEDMKKFYSKAGLGKTPGTCSIVAIFIFPFIMSIMLYANTHEALTEPELVLKELKKSK